MTCAGITWGLRRWWRAGQWPSLLGATMFQLGGFFASQAQHLGAVNGAAWLPLVWLCVVAQAQRASWRWAALICAARRAPA